MINKPGCSALSMPPSSTAEHVRVMALNLFVDRGFERVSVRELAAAIKVHAGSLYNHIESKQSLLYDLIEEHESGLLHALNQCQDVFPTPSSAFNTYIESYVLFQLNNQKTAALARLELRSLSVEQQKSIKKFRAGYQRNFEQAITNLSKFHEIGDLDVRIAAHGLLEMLNGLASAFSMPSQANEISHLIERIQRLVFGAIRGYSPDRLQISASSNQAETAPLKTKTMSN